MGPKVRMLDQKAEKVAKVAKVDEEDRSHKINGTKMWQK